MGLGCSKKLAEDEGDSLAVPTVRLSPFRPRRCSLGRRSRALAAGMNTAGGGAVNSLLTLAVNGLAATLHQQPAPALAQLPADLSQLLLDRLVACGQLDDAAVQKLTGLGLHFYHLPLGSYPELVQASWLRCLSTASLQEADLGKTGVNDEALAALGCPPHIKRLHLDYCIDITDAGLAVLQGLVTLQDLSLAGCEQLTALGLRWLGGLTRLRRLDLQTCRQISNLALLQNLRQLEHLNLGWCSGLGDEDAAVLAHLSQLRELHLARTQVSDDGLHHLHQLSRLQVLNLAGVHASDAALAALLAQLPLLEVLNLERCLQAGDAALAAVGKHASRLRELYLGYTAVSDTGLRELRGLVQLRVLNVENCSVGDRGLEVLGSVTGLHTLDLSDTSATNASMPLVAGLRQLECLNLSFTGVNDWGLKRLTHLTALRCLNLDSRLFTDNGMESVSKLGGLECLDLFGARISDVGCAAISKLKKLRRLEVCGGGVTDAGVAHLAAIATLQHLSLAQNYRVSNRSICSLIKLNELTALNLSQCRVTSNSVVALGCLPLLSTLALYDTKVKPLAVDKLLAANPELCVQGVSPSTHRTN